MWFTCTERKPTIKVTSQIKRAILEDLARHEQVGEYLWVRFMPIETAHSNKYALRLSTAMAPGGAFSMFGNLVLGDDHMTTGSLGTCLTISCS